MTDAADYVNPRTGARWSGNRPLWRAPDDGGYVDLVPGKGLAPEAIDRAARSIWRYRRAIRIAAPPKVTLGEGWTPLLPGTWEGRKVLVKCDHLMPSGSFKDRGTAVMLNYLAGLGIGEILEDSSGNAGASIATYAAALGLGCRVFVPATAPAAKRAQIAAMGAEVVAVEGGREDVATAALAAARSTFYASHNRQPFFLEGMRTLAFEIWEQLGFRAPDCIVAPLGQGSLIMGCHLGFCELLARGAVEAVPRLYGVQAARCAPFHKAFVAGAAEVELAVRPTIADGIASERPVRLAEVLAAVHRTKGAILAVEEEEIVAALRRLCGMGYFVEPTSAVAGAGLSRLFADRQIGADETVVVILTGSGLKAVDKIGQALALR